MEGSEDDLVALQGLFKGSSPEQP